MVGLPWRLIFAKAEVRLGGGVGEGVASKNADTVVRRSRHRGRSINVSCIVSVRYGGRQREQSRKPDKDDKLRVKQS